MGKIKFRIFVISVMAIMVTLISQTTLAYYSVLGKNTNVITSGNIRFIIHERTDQGKEFPKEGVYIVPGDIVSKQVSIENDCEHPFYLRVKIVYGINSEELPYEECFKLNINQEDWLYSDGWYYYKEPVAVESTTSNVFSHVEMVGTVIDNKYIGKILTLTVIAQAVQSENNEAPDGDVTKVEGWPKEAEG